ncbi:hypothetical protein [Microbispora sp. CA-102843]|uniref:hypothetical protein n=1 Tax=Microbispora sp. CA-102843 TaxID=3239952 RepID=UPI003D8F9878
MIVQPQDLVTPSQFGAVCGVPAGTVRSWISRKRIQPVGRIGPYNVYDFLELADLEREMRAPDEAGDSVLDADDEPPLSALDQLHDDLAPRPVRPDAVVAYA